MKLNYRGVSYEYNPPAVAVDEGKIAGKFRGLDWRFHNHKKPMVLQPNANLTYRGVAYNNHPQTDVDNTATTSIKESARWLMLNKEKAAKNRAASMLSRAASEIGLA